MTDKEVEGEPDTYKVSSQAVKKVDDLMNLDKNDDSLQKWKATLLGSALSADVAPKDDPRRVVITEMTIVCPGRPGGDITYTFDNKDQIAKLKDNPFVLKEGCQYKIRLRFRVQHELCTGLKHVNTAYRKGVRVGKDETMIGSYGPQVQPHEVIIPRKDFDEAPKGLLARGKYTANSKFVDDDGKTHLEYEYSFAIKKEWASTSADDDEKD